MRLSSFLLSFCVLSLVAAQGPPPLNCIRPTSRPAALPTDRQWSRGPQFGTLIVAGGGLVTNSTVFQRFLQEAGGRSSAKIIYIPTNAGTDFSTPDRRQRELNEFLQTAQFGQLTFPVELLHTYNRAEANSPEFYGAIDEATAVYFRGGLPFWSYDAYKDTETENALRRLLQRGGVVGGSSAGALMQSNIMLRGDRSQNNQIVLGNPWIGFSFGNMENIIFDVHNLQRNRAHDLIEVLEVFPQHLGINIDEDTAIVMKNDVFESVGTGWVQIFDPTLWQPTGQTPLCANFLYSTGSGRTHVGNGGRSHFLWARRRTTAGDRYNVRTRQVISALTEADIKALMTEQEV